MFVILGECGGLVLLADGDLRKLAKPKRKKRMHLKSRPWVMDALAESAEKGALSDSDIRKALEAVRSGMV